MMEKIVLIDGNNLLFRSYYATAYSGNMMRNSKGFPTNGLFGFVNMINKIISDESPSYMMVAFDVGKTFRHEEYKDYKGGRIETPDELKLQFPKAKEILDAMGIRHLEVNGYEADDIVGTFARMIDESDGYEGLIVSSDKDLLQLISDKVSVKLLKSKDYIMMTEDSFREYYGILPIRMIDLKGLMGDSSDNIPGVKGIGEKTALKLLREYDTIENLYDNIEKVKGALYDKLVDGRDSAFYSKKLATIYREVPIESGFDDIRYNGGNDEELIKIYNELEFYSFIKKIDVVNNTSKIEVNIVRDVSKLDIRDVCGVFIEVDGDNYHKCNIIGISIYNDKNSLYIPYEYIGDFSYVKGDVYTYDVKKMWVMLKRLGLVIPNVCFDVMISSYLLNYNVKDDIAYVARDLGYELVFYDKKEELSLSDRAYRAIEKAKFIYEIYDKLNKDMVSEGVRDLYYDIEYPLAFVLAKMEYTGIRCDVGVLESMGRDISKRVDEVSQEIYKESGVEFNISSPKQLGSVLFEKMGLPHGKKNKSGYATDEGTLMKLIEYPIIGKILEYRMLTKLYSTYIEGLCNSVMEDGKIHTIYTQTLTRTGRLSSIEPNLQNIPVRNEYGKLIRKAFLAESDSVIMSSDYSQIELRIFSHLAGVEELIKAFHNGMDIHTKTASDVFGVSPSEVTKDMRRSAKAVNFGIIYGISSYGLADDLGISNKEAKEFIDNYFKAYPGIKSYMDRSREEARRDGYVKTIMNRKRVIKELNNTNYMIRSMGERMALNAPIQGSSADILKKAMVEIDREFSKRGLKSTMLLQVHDELIFNVCNDELEEVKGLVKDIMENTYKLSVPLEVDINIGSNWYDAK